MCWLNGALAQTGEMFLYVASLWSLLLQRPSSPNTAPAPGPQQGWRACTLWSGNLPRTASEPPCWARILPLRSCSLAWCTAWSVCQSKWARRGCGSTEPSAGCPPRRRCRRLPSGTSRRRRHGARTRSGRLGSSSSRAGRGLPWCRGPPWGSLDPPQSSWTPPHCNADSRWPWHDELCVASYTDQSSPNREHALSGTTYLQARCLHLEGQSKKCSGKWCKGENGM